MKNLTDSPSPLANFLARRAHLIALALFAIIGIAVLDDYGVSTDAKAQRNTGYASFSYVLGDEDILPNHIDRYYGVAFELPLFAVERLLGLEDSRAVHLSRHLLAHLFFLAAGGFCWLLAYRLFGNRLVAMLAMLVFLLHPRLYAHSFFNSKDLPFLSMFMIALYLIHRAFRRDSVWAFALCGAGIALLMNIRIMGVMLLPAVLGMLALDAFHAMKRDGRTGMKRTIANAAAFIAAFGATLYAAWPLLWRDPSQVADAFRYMSNHPTIISTLFRGEWVRWPNMPWDYIPTWILITTPPVVLTLAALGTGFAVYLCAARRRDMLADSTARFGLLALACLILPAAAVIALNSNVYGGWRQMHFLYAPICVLAAYGLRALAAIPKPRFRSAAYALAALGIALAAVQIVSLHPVQDSYFNPLADKSGLADRWQIDYWGVSQKQALERMLDMQPAGRVSVNSCNFTGYALDRNLEIIPREDRLRTSVNWFSPDFCTYGSANPAWTREIYGTTVASLTDTRDSARRDYADAYALAKSRTPDFRAHFDVHVADGLIIYIKEPCAESDTLGTFAISARPVNPDAAAGYLREDGFGGKSFGFWDYGGIMGDACLMALRAPTYPLESARIAYRPPNSERETWSADIPVNSHLKAYESATSSKPLAQSGFDIYEDGGTLTYVKPQCAESDTLGRFNLSVHPVDRNDLPESARSAGLEHESLNFDFHRHGAIFDGKCVIVQNLPDYPISHIQTGQWIPGGEGLWNVRVLFPGYSIRFRAALSALSGETPAARSGFDIYARDGALTYVKRQCAETDARGRFSLSAHPVDAGDLPQSARDAGLKHEPLNFDFHRQGAIFDGVCVAIVDLPDYRISRVETAQWIPGEGGLWNAEIRFPGYYDRFRDALSALSGATPAASAGGFDIYMDGGTLTYVKPQCADDDTRGRFLLSVFPADPSDIADEMREQNHAHNSLNFDFAEYGAIFDGKCVIVRELPDYPIGDIETGQWLPGDRHLWSARIAVGE